MCRRWQICFLFSHISRDSVRGPTPLLRLAPPSVFAARLGRCRRGALALGRRPLQRSRPACTGEGDHRTLSRGRISMSAQPGQGIHESAVGSSPPLRALSDAAGCQAGHTRTAPLRPSSQSREVVLTVSETQFTIQTNDGDQSITKMVCGRIRDGRISNKRAVRRASSTSGSSPRATQRHLQQEGPK